HGGLAGPHNAGVGAGRGGIAAFLGAGATADRDWLYHLVETITRRNAAAAGGPNFAPTPTNARAAIMAAAPGFPREVPDGDEGLAQLCGCNMAIRISALKRIGGFDSAFTAAGEDVDISHRLREQGELLAYSPGA